jgi:NADH-quinone oxidoreductase subunit E
MSVAESKITLLTSETREKIDVVLGKFPEHHKRSAVLMALHYVQKQNDGWLSPELMDATAEYLQLEPILVYEVATFYDMYDLKPCGKNKIRVCTNISCMLRGSDEIMQHLKNRLNVDVGGSTADGEFMLKEAECLAGCAGAPMIQINDEYYENLTPEKIDEILAQWESK